MLIQNHANDVKFSGSAGLELCGLASAASTSHLPVCTTVVRKCDRWLPVIQESGEGIKTLHRPIVARGGGAVLPGNRPAGSPIELGWIQVGRLNCVWAHLAALLVYTVDFGLCFEVCAIKKAAEIFSHTRCFRVLASSCYIDAA